MVFDRARRRLLETGEREQPALLSQVFEPILAEARRQKVGDGVTTALEDDGVYIEAGDRSPTLTADEARRLADEVEHRRTRGRTGRRPARPHRVVARLCRRTRRRDDRGTAVHREQPNAD